MTILTPTDAAKALVPPGPQHILQLLNPDGTPAGRAALATLTALIASAAVTVPVTTVAASGAAQTLTFPASGNAAYDLTLTANCALSLSGGTAGQLQALTLILRQDATAGRLPALPASVKWPGGTAPTPNTAAGGIDVFTFTTPDARATVLGSY